jgi:hypothetical protein
VANADHARSGAHLHRRASVRRSRAKRRAGERLTLMLFVAPAQAGAHGHRAIACSVAMGSRLRGNDALGEGSGEGNRGATNGRHVFTRRPPAADLSQGRATCRTAIRSYAILRPSRGGISIKRSEKTPRLADQTWGDDTTCPTSKCLVKAIRAPALPLKWRADYPPKTCQSFDQRRLRKRPSVPH